MARTIGEIYDALITEKQNYAELQQLQPNIDDNQSLLDDLTSSSKVAIWRLLFFVIAVGIHIHELLFDTHEQEVIDIRNLTPTNTTRWLADQSKKFQYGDALSYNETNGKYEYNVINSSNKIVKLASVTEFGNNVLIKVAKLDGNGLPEPLTTAEKSAFDGYVNIIRAAGQQIEIRSDIADRLRLNLNVYYDPLVLNPDGTLISDPSINPVEEAISSYVEKGIPFDGIYRTGDLEQAIAAAEGVRDSQIQSDTYQFGILSNPYVEIVDNVTPFAGYLRLDTAGSTINYINNTTV